MGRQIDTDQSLGHWGVKVRERRGKHCSVMQCDAVLWFLGGGHFRDLEYVWEYETNDDNSIYILKLLHRKLMCSQNFQNCLRQKYDEMVE